jgi:formylglycine-generating enzyme required for sulfatase activity
MYCNWLSQRDELTPCYERTGTKDEKENDEWRAVPGANGYRLPTDAEWGYACRAGTLTVFSFGNDELLLDRYGVVRTSGMEIPGSKLPNGWGMFDAHGNAFEWCHDWYGANDDEATTIGDPKGPEQGSSRVVRGGSFDYYALHARSAYRSGYPPDQHQGDSGFRVARCDRYRKQDTKPHAKKVSWILPWPWKEVAASAWDSRTLLPVPDTQLK